MARVALSVADAANRFTLQAILESAGHRIVDSAAETPDVRITDEENAAMARRNECPVLLLAAAAQIPRAIELMREGVAGYLFVPLQPGEADIRVRQLAGTGPAVDPPLETLAAAEARIIRDTLRRCRNNRSEAARILGIGRNTLWRKLKQSGEADRES